MNSKTKIVCTIGPATSAYATLQELVGAGMSVARLNFSHGSHDEHLAVIESIKRLRNETGVNIGILQDLSGPKIRVGDLPDEGIDLATGAELMLKSGDRFEAENGRPIVPINHTALTDDVPPGGRILLDDGIIALEVVENSGKVLRCRVTHGGVLQRHKGVNFPGLVLSREVPTSKDLDDLAFGLRHGVDFVAQSFVQSAEEILRLREVIDREQSPVGVVAKLERSNALDNVDGILKVSDGAMIARGDLGLEAELSMIPIYQKLIVRKCNLLGMLVITATQMLDSMIRQPIPTRAEVTDVANAIYDGSDAIMLSGETSIGAFPIESVKMMRKIADNVEQNLGLDRGWIRQETDDLKYSHEMAVSASVCQAAHKLNAKLIVAYTISGKTARTIAMYRPSTPIVALTPLASTHHQLSLVWGIRSILLPDGEDQFLRSVKQGESALKQHGLAIDGDVVVVSAGIPAGHSGGTNLMKIHVVGEG